MRSIHLCSGSCPPFLLFILLLLFTNTSLLAQQVVKGSVADRDGKTLAGATIAIKDSKRVTTSDSAGRFSLTVAPGSVIEISYVGYINKQIIITDQAELHVFLEEAALNLNDVVVIGYGTAMKKDVTGAVAKISSGEFNTGVITSPLEQIQGKVAGLVVTQPGGDPNGDFVVRLRGATSLEGQPPLLVIDGIAIDDFFKSITTLNPADIESFDILKDASAAAIYGSRGANGVILVTTKKGRAGKTVVDYSGFVSAEKISNEIKVLNSDEYLKATNGGAGFNQGGNTDWQKAISQTGISHSHSIGISGGTNQMNYRGSVSYTKNEGVIINTGKEVMTARLNINQKTLKNKLEINYDVNLSGINRDFLPDQSSTSQSRMGGSSLFYFALVGLPVTKVYNVNRGGYQGPVFDLKQKYNKKRENFSQGSVKADYDLLNGLKLGVLAAVSRGNDVFDYFSPAPDSSNVLSVATKSNDNKQVYSGDIHANYRKRFRKHSVDLTGVYEYNDYANDGFVVSASGFLIPSLVDNNLGAATQVLTSGISSYKNDAKLISFLGRAVYNYDDRYIMTANFRRDGSSKFGPNHRWGNFPSVSVAWRASNELFLKGVTWLNNLKLRLSYGLTGNQENLGPYPYQLLYGPTGPYLYNGQFLQGYGVAQQDNPDLKWEVRKSLNAGIDFSVLNNRVAGTIDVFNDKTNDMLFQYDLPQPPFLFNQVTANAANAINRGVEITINTELITNKTFQWNLSGNLATLKNRITNLSGQFEGAILSLTDAEQHYGYAEGNGLSGAYISQLKTGYPAGVFWLPQHAGFDAMGHELYNNYDATGKLTGTSTNYSDQDRVYIDPAPHYTWGLTNTFDLGNFDLVIFFRGVQGQKIFANSLMVLGATVDLPYFNVSEKALTNGFKDQPQPSTYWLQNGSFARLQNLTIGYHFKNIKGLSTLRIYMTATNLFIITKYQGVDPEINTDGPQRYIDNNYYPQARGFTIGVNCVF